jgi:hypothetical protein
VYITQEGKPEEKKEKERKKKAKDFSQPPKKDINKQHKQHKSTNT